MIWKEAFAVVGLTLLFAVLFSAHGGRPPEYAGSEACAECHGEIAANFHGSNHPRILRTAEQGKREGIVLPDGYDWDDILYVVGGVTKKVRFVDRNGFLLTTAADGSPAPTQYNLESGRWVDYMAGKRKPYGCGRCHTTGFQEAGNGSSPPGIQGDWALMGVQCEACHGPASRHVKYPQIHHLEVDASSALCGRCHSRGDVNTLPAKGGFLQHHQQYNEILAGGHGSLACVDCHDPHSTDPEMSRHSCYSCHRDRWVAFWRADPHGRAGLHCVECHMPLADRSADSPKLWCGDIRTHLFRIETGAGAMLTEAADRGRPFVSLDYACLRCHEDRDLEWAKQHGASFHGAAHAARRAVSYGGKEPKTPVISGVLGEAAPGIAKPRV